MNNLTLTKYFLVILVIFSNFSWAKPIDKCSIYYKANFYVKALSEKSQKKLETDLEQMLKKNSAFEFGEQGSANVLQLNFIFKQTQDYHSMENTLTSISLEVKSGENNPSHFYSHYHFKPSKNPFRRKPTVSQKFQQILSQIFSTDLKNCQAIRQK